MARTLLIDNHDSFTYNLAWLIEAASGERPVVVRNDEASWNEIAGLAFDYIVISPGPGHPAHADDLGLSAHAIALATVPVLGVCLGHQAIAQHFGARVDLANEPVHGRVSDVFHRGEGLFAGIPSPFAATRYHSLAVTDLPDELVASAWTDDGTLMALSHATRPIWGVQFHPESVSSEHGERLIRNFFALGAAHMANARSAPLPGDVERIHVRRCPGGIAPEAAYQALVGAHADGFWLDSSRPHETSARFSYFGDVRGPRAEVVTYRTGEGHVTVNHGGVEREEAGDIFTYLETQLAARRQPAVGDAPFDFHGGYVGWFGYELKGDLLGSSAHRARTADASWIFADRVVAYDHREHAYWLFCLDAASVLSKENADWFEHALSVVSGTSALPAPVGDGAVGDGAVGDRHDDERTAPHELSTLQWRHAPETYLAMVHRSQELIRHGETYEVCLTNELTARLDADALTIYLTLRTLNPAPFGAFLKQGETSVLCSSPELFLGISADGHVESKPIKGTAPRDADPLKDRHLAEALAGSMKNRSENLMIVDLVRNDLNRCCEGGSVHVPVLFGVESYATVHQLVSTIRGTLAKGRTAMDCVREAFPGGSMTGAPKVRTMSIIDELEGGPRGIYSGSIGYLSLNGAARLNIVIRTIVMKGDTLSIGAGGAIVALSDPDEELAEVTLKAKAQINALQQALQTPATNTATP